MKKSFLFFALLAGVAVMTGCKKDQDVVTLKAVIDTDSKAYFGDADRIRPYWDSNDQVIINGETYDLSFPNNTPTTYATISGVTANDNGYCAIYPADIVEKMAPPAANGQALVSIYYRPDQQYIRENGHQRINMPMGAVIDDDGKTFHFKNLCSILRLDVTNTYGQPVKVGRITVQTHSGYVAGSASVTLTKTGDPVVVMDDLGDEHDNVLSVYPAGYGTAEMNTRADGYIKEMAVSGTASTASFDVVVPPFTATELNVELELYSASGTFLGNSDYTIKRSASDPLVLDLNKIVTIELNTYDDNFQPANYAYLEPGPDFNADIKNLINSFQGGLVNNISFHKIENENNIPTGAIEVQDLHSAYKVWAYIVRSEGHYQVSIDCVAPLIYANKNSSYMFADLSTIATMNWNNKDGITPDGAGLQTEDVVDMSYMFKGCTSLSSISDADFNTTNVWTMAHMFDSCSSLSSFDNLNISNFNTHNLHDMEAMFKNCSSLGSVNLSHFHTNRVTKMKELFSGCTSLQTITLSSSFTTAQVTDMSNLFYHCRSLSSVDLSSFTTNQVTNMSYFFAGCENLTGINMRQFVISPNTNIDSMCHRLNYAHPSLNQRNPSQSPCYITCSRSTWNTMKGQATDDRSVELYYGSPDPTTGFSTLVIYDRDVFDD